MEFIKKYWLYGVLSLQLVLLVIIAWYVQGQLARHQTAIINEANTITQIVDYLNKATQKQ